MTNSPFPDPSVLFQQAVSLHRSGNVAQAAALYRQLLRRFPPNPQILDALGAAELQLGNAKESVALLKKLLNMSPNQPRALCNMGMGLHNLGRLDEALGSYDRAIALNPGYALAYNNRGNVLKDLDQPDQALASYDRAIGLNSNYAEAHNNRGNVLKELKRPNEALASFDRAIALDPHYAVAHCNRGIALTGLKRLDEALISFDRSIALDRSYAGAHCSRAGALADLGRWDEALASCRRALAIDPGFVEAHLREAFVLLSLKRPDEALASCDRLIALDPGNGEAHFRKSTIKLLVGDFASGWELYEWRWKTPTLNMVPRDFGKPRWTGEQSLAGKTLLVDGEQGMGDVVQFCRYAPMVRALGAKVIIEAQKRLLPLLSSMKCDVTFVEMSNPPPDCDLQCPLMSLPLAFKTRLETIPAEVPYLFADPDKVREVLRKLGDKTLPRIGLVWSGSPTHVDDHNRSIPLERFAPLLQLPYEFHALQIDIRPEDAAALARFPQLRTHLDEQDDFSDAAALIEAMDLVITVDAVLSHVAGALGKKVWVLNAWVPDWRWMLDRSDSPWYPSATLFRQPAKYDWNSVFDEIAARLQSEF